MFQDHKNNLIELNNKQNEVNNNDEIKQLAPPVVTLYSSEDSGSNSPNSQTPDLKPQQNTIMSSSEHQFRIPDAFPIGSNPPVNKSIPAAASSLMKSSSMNNLLRKNENESQLQKPSSKQLLGSLPNRASVSAASSCGHHGAGQELCYLCHQRSKRNVPIYLHEEKRHKEAEEQQLLQQYQHLKDTESKLKDEAGDNLRRDERAKQDAFNLGVADAIRQRKQERPRSTDISVSR